MAKPSTPPLTADTGAALDIRIGQLRALLAVVAEGGIGAGARHLGMAQPTLTRAIQQMEIALGAPVLVRGPGGLELTDFGRTLLPHAQRLVKAHEKAQEAAAQLAGSHEARLAVAASALPRLLLMPQASRALWQRFADAQLAITEASYPRVLRGLESGVIDFALCPVPLDAVPDRFETERLLDVRLAVTLRAGHPRRHAASLAELADAEWIAAGPPFGQGLREAFAANGLPAPATQVHCESLEHALRLVGRTDMLTLAPATVVARSALPDALRQPMLRDAMPTLSIAVLLPRQRALSPAAALLLEAIREAAHGLREGCA